MSKKIEKKTFCPENKDRTSKTQLSMTIGGVQLQHNNHMAKELSQCKYLPTSLLPIKNTFSHLTKNITDLLGFEQPECFCQPFNALFSSYNLLMKAVTPHICCYSNTSTPWTFTGVYGHKRRPQHGICELRPLLLTFFFRISI